MNALKTIMHEILGLFVDDGSFALAIVLWLGLVGVAARHANTAFAAILLFLGLAAILVESVTRFARKSKR